MWDLITAERQRRSIVLTTHSMEECEALCSRVGIIAMGRLQCLGGTQHLKSKFGGGYTIELSVGEAHAAGLPAAFDALFPGARLSEQHVGKYRYALPRGSASLAPYIPPVSPLHLPISPWPGTRYRGAARASRASSRRWRSTRRAWAWSTTPRRSRRSRPSS